MQRHLFPWLRERHCAWQGLHWHSPQISWQILIFHHDGKWRWHFLWHPIWTFLGEGWGGRVFNHAISPWRSSCLAYKAAVYFGPIIFLSCVGVCPLSEHRLEELKRHNRFDISHKLFNCINRCLQTQPCPSAQRNSFMQLPILPLIAM